MNRIDHQPGRGSESSRRDRKNPVNVTAAAASQMKTPTARTQGECPVDITMMPTRPIANPEYPTRRAQTAILQCLLYCSSDGSFMPSIVPWLGRPGSSVRRSRHSPVMSSPIPVPMPRARQGNESATQASADPLMAANVAPIPLLAASLRLPISWAASSPKTASKKAAPSGGSSQVSVTFVPPSTAANE
jgi:hypothetical protein